MCPAGSSDPRQCLRIDGYQHGLRRHSRAMRRRRQKVVVPLWAAVFLTASLEAGLPPISVKAAADSRIVTEGIAIAGSVSNSTISNTVNQENPATLAMLAKALADKDASEEYRRQAEVKAAELATKFGFTS